MEKLSVFFKSISPKMWIIIGIVIVVIIFLIIYFKNKSKTTSNSNGLIKANPPAQTLTSLAIFPLAKGSRGAEVKSLQSFLNANGAVLVTDGIWGPLTQAAVDKYFKTTIGTVSEVFYNASIKGKY